MPRFSAALRSLIRRAPEPTAHEGASAWQGAIKAPLHTDWAYRPSVFRAPLPDQVGKAVESGARIGADMMLFHYGGPAAVGVRQSRHDEAAFGPSFALSLDATGLDGAFLSLVVDLPPAAMNGLSRHNLVHLATSIELANPLTVFARLNVQYGPNSDQMVRGIDLRSGAVGGAVGVDFDLAYSKINDKRIERAWIDLIFEGQDLGRITVNDLTLSRRPRAEF